MSIYKHGRKWWISYYWNGKQVREGVSASRREAENALALRRAEILKGRFHYVPRKELVMFPRAVEEYKVEKAEKRSLRRDETSFRHLTQAFGLMRIDRITTKDIEAYKRARAGQHSQKRKGLAVAGGTVNRELALLKCLFNQQIDLGRIAENPVKGVKFFPERPKTADRVLTSLELEHLVEAAAPHLRPIIAVAAYTGLRKGDILNLRPADIDLEGGVIRVLMQKTEELLLVPILPELKPTLCKAMAAAGPSAPYVFMSFRPRRDGKFSKIGDIKNAFRGALARADLAGQGFTFHSLRHTFASTLYRSGVPLLAVSKLLGHRSVKTTERYLGVRLEEMRQAVAVLSGVYGEGVLNPALTITGQAQNPEQPRALPCRTA